MLAISQFNIEQPHTQAKPSEKLVARYDYTDAAGITLFRKYRYEPKRFSIARPTRNGRYEWGLGNVPPVLYRLPDLLASEAHVPVFFVEGEKDADLLAGAGFLATTNFDGAGKWCREYNNYLSGRTVWILPDNDEPGENHASLVANSIYNDAFLVKVIRLPGLGPKQDVSDWLAMGHSPEELYDLCLDTPEWEPSTNELHPVQKGVNALDTLSANGQVATLRTVSMQTLLSQQFAPLIFLVTGLIALGYLVVLAGRPKSGKSWLGLQLAMCVDTGRPFLGRDTYKSKVLLIALEDGERRVHQRAKQLGWAPSETAVLAINIARFDGPNGTPGPGLAQIEQMATRYDLIIIDTLIATLSGNANENDNVQMAMIVNSLARIAHETNTAVVLVHHTGKGYSDDVFNTLRGASAIRGGYDVGLLLERKQGEQEAVLHAESRDIEVENMTLRQAANGAGWEYVGNSFEIEKIRAGKDTLKAILELDPDAKGLTAKDIANHRRISESAVYRQLNRLLDDGHVEKVAMPSTSEGKEANLYYIVQEPQT